jgi:cytoskeletal protein RodZ
MKKKIMVLLLLLSFISLSACNNKKETADSKPKEITVSKAAKKKKVSSTKTTETTQSSSAQTTQTPQASQSNQATPEANYVAPNQSSQTPQAPAVEQPAQNQPAATTDWMTPERRAELIEGGKFDPTFVDNLSQADYQLAADRAQQRLEETGYGDVSLIWYELYKMNPESTTLFDNAPYDSYAE